MKSINQKIQSARTKYDQLKEVQEARELLNWREAELLNDLKKSRDYKYVFGVDEKENVRQSWGWFVQECGYPRVTADFKTKVFEYWVEQWKFPLSFLVKYSIRKLHIMIPYLNNKEEAKKMLEETKDLPVDELIKHLQDNYTRKNKETVTTG